MFAFPFWSRPRPARALFLAGLLAAALPAYAVASGWERSHANGTAAASAANDAGARMTFYCGDPSAAEENPAIQRGQYMIVKLPKAAESVAEGSREIEIVVDGQIFLVPVTFARDGETATARWEPSDDWTVSQMTTLIDAMQIGDEVVFDEEGANVAFGLENAEGALEDIFECD